MKRTAYRLILLSILALAATAPAAAQEVTIKPAPTPRQQKEKEQEISLGEITPTQEMWFYQQELKRAQDPKQAIRRRAEYRAAQRERRLASQEWYGVSPLRPNANITPWMGGSYSPGWSGNSRDSFRWSPATPVVVVPFPSYQGIYGVR
ncbi:MAG: hypothetical protein JNG90_11850 [Planctomycetaceae bacterium]|nr:hypothetical protein [Planctomycetaceae bacterium]